MFDNKKFYLFLALQNKQNRNFKFFGMKLQKKSTTASPFAGFFY